MPCIDITITREDKSPKIADFKDNVKKDEMVNRSVDKEKIVKEAESVKNVGNDKVNEIENINNKEKNVMAKIFSVMVIVIVVLSITKFLRK